MRGPLPERGQVHACGETRERVSRARESHVERVDVCDADVREQVALVNFLRIQARRLGSSR